MPKSFGQSIPQKMVGLEELAAVADCPTIIDIGVFAGTEELYSAFADRNFVLVDPIRNGENLLRCAPERYLFVNKALGRETGSVTLKAMGLKTTINDRTALSAGPIRAEYEVEVITLDQLIDAHVPSGSIGMKIDTEGYELEVVRGLQRNRDRVSFIICETSIRRRFVDGYMFSDLIAAMKEAGFEFYNFMNHRLRTPRLYDLLFLKSDHHLFD